MIYLRFCDSFHRRSVPFAAHSGADILTAVCAGAVGELHVAVGRQWISLTPHICVGYGPQTRHTAVLRSGFQADAVEHIDAPSDDDAARWFALADETHHVWATGADDEAWALRSDREVLLADLRENLRRKLAWVPEAREYDDLVVVPENAAEFEHACRANGLGRDYDDLATQLGRDLAAKLAE